VAEAAEPQASVLIVDEDAGRQQSLKGLIGDGYAVSVVTDAGRVPAESAAADVVLLNMRSTELNPYQMLRRIKSPDAQALASTVVIAPADSSESVSRCLAMGCDDYVIEPLHPALLQTRIAAGVAAARMRSKVAEEEFQELRTEEALRVTEKYEHDVLIGRQIQAGFLPKVVPQPTGWEIAGRFQPAREVAGDWWDAFSLDHIRRTGLVIADVCDKGVGAALFMALMRSLIRAFAQLPSSLRWLDALETNGPVATALAGGTAGARRAAPTAGSTALRNAIEQTNNYIAHNHGDTGMFATLFFAILDPTNGQMQYINGGHEPPIIIGVDGSIKNRLKPSGMAVGMMEGSPFEALSVQLEPGEVLLTYTDGGPEARDPDRKFFTEARLLDLVSHPVTDANALLDTIMDHLRAHIADADQFDDITMLAARRLPS
jgi:serine phosphatase RsbU (regulator of sigma subunit)